MVDEEFVHILEAMVPIHHAVLLADLQAALDHKIYNFREMLFGRGDLPGVYISFFEGGEIQLTWGDVI